MNKVLIGVVVLAVVVLLVFTFSSGVDLAPKSSAKKSAGSIAKTNPSSNPFEGANSNSISAHQFAFMVDITDGHGSSDIPATGLFLITAGKVNSIGQNDFFNFITKSDSDYY